MTTNITQVAPYHLLEGFLTPIDRRKHKTINSYANCGPSGLEPLQQGIGGNSG